MLIWFLINILMGCFAVFQIVQTSQWPASTMKTVELVSCSTFLASIVLQFIGFIELSEIVFLVSLIAMGISWYMAYHGGMI